jgi:hypothetical protein
MITAFLICLFYLQNLACVSEAQVDPLSVEFDVVFPRNDTYAPISLMPIVFTLQNPQASLIIGLQMWIFRIDDLNDALIERTLDLTGINFRQPLLRGQFQPALRRTLYAT